ncbi:hypothetical protein JTB14_029117 [Gonioctena quinquepunctata]|nr:hypothetical protein JTB14_029117 [Gonioctena quinquepunctata]
MLQSQEERQCETGILRQFMETKEEQKPKSPMEDRNGDRMDTESNSARNHRKNAGTHSLDPNFEWPIGFGNANVISKDNDVNELPKEDNIMTSHPKTHSIRTTKSRLSNTSTDIQRRRLAIEAEKQKQDIENRMMEMEKVKYLKQLKLIEMERQVREAEIIEYEERRSQTTSVKSNSVSNRNVYTKVIVHNPNVESCSSKSSLMPAAENQQLRRNPVSRVNSYVTDWVNSLEPFVKNDDPYISVQNPRNEDVIKSDVDKLCEALGEVAWVRAEDQTILSLHTKVVTHNNRVSVTHDDPETWKLRIRPVKESDRGCYLCQINTPVLKSQKGCLDVFGKCLKGFYNSGNE